MWRKIKINFFTGLLIVVPVALTFWVLYFIISKLNLLLLEPVMEIFQMWLPDRVSVELFTKVAIFFILLGLLTLTGFAARIIIVRKVFGFGENILYKVPMINTIYKGLKDMSAAFLSGHKSIFKKVVLVEYPKNGVYAIGFVTSVTKGEAQEKTKKDVINIFVPTTPNPTSGMLVLVPESDVIILDMSVEDGMKMIISGGVVTPVADYGNTKNRSDTFKKEGFQGN
ncbi:MAG: DUF502 domain-containing protein [Candidatus Omnitrophota bacterium]|nr:DUF502 domain-containing protein [Candidatus Omnitrophota bacterium]